MMVEALNAMDWSYIFGLLEIVLTVAALTVMLALFKICHWLIRSDDPDRKSRLEVEITKPGIKQEQE